MESKKDRVDEGLGWQLQHPAEDDPVFRDLVERGIIEEPDGTMPPTYSMDGAHLQREAQQIIQTSVER